MFGSLVLPARKLSHWLTFRQKFLVIFLIALLPSLVLLALNLLDRYQDIKRDGAEIAGMHYIAKIGPATKALRDHRGMHAMVAGGYAQAANDDGRISQEVDAALDALDREAANFPEAAQWRHKLGAIRTDWNALKQNWSGMSIADSFARHSALILTLNEFCHHVAGDTGLLLDPDASAYYLMAIQIDDLPALNEILGKIRGQMAQLKTDDPRLSYTLSYVDYQLNNALLAQVQRIDNNVELLGDEYPSDRRVIEGGWAAVKGVIAALRTDFNAILAKESFSEPGQRQAIFARVSAIFDNTAAFQKLLQKQLLVEKLGKRYQAEVHSMSAAAAIGLAVLCLVAWLIAGFAQDLTQRVDLLNQGMRRIGQGDLRQPISLTGRDEMVSLAQSINTLLDQLSQSLSMVKRSAHELLDTSNDIASASQQVAQSTFAQSNAASSMAASIEELTVSINHMADNARQAHAQSDDSGRASQDGSVIIGQAVESIMAIAASVRASAGSVQALGEDARAISGIAEVIKEIADQTNLLALNAAIESARAGETGRGFAVVADEVRKLAERTTACTAQISQMISRIQQGTDSVVDAMRQGVAKVEHGMALANQAGTAIARIRAGSVDTAGAVNEISVALNQQSATAQTVAAKVETIAQMSEQNNRAAETSAATAEQLRSLALTLEQRMAAFQIAA